MRFQSHVAQFMPEQHAIMRMSTCSYSMLALLPELKALHLVRCSDLQVS